MANNPIKTDEIIQNNGEIREVIEELRIASEVMEDFRKKALKNADQIMEVVKAADVSNAQGRESLEAGAAAAAKITDELRNYNRVLDSHAKKVKTLTEIKGKLKSSDIYQDNGDLKELIKDLKEIDKLTKSLAKTGGISASAPSSPSGANGSSTSSSPSPLPVSPEAVDLTEEMERRLQKYNESLDENAVKIAALKNAQQDINRLNKLEAKLLAAKEGSYNALSAQYSLNKLELNQLSREERKNTVEGQELEKQTREIYEEMKRLQEVTGKHTLSVGDYTKGIRNAAKDQQRLVQELDESKKAFRQMAESVGVGREETEAFNRDVAELEGQIESLGSVTGKTADEVRKDLAKMSKGGADLGDALEGAIPGAGALRGALQTLGKTPVLAVVLLIVGAVTALFGAFSRSKKGADLLAKAAGALEGILSVLTAISLELVDVLIAVWEDPIGSMESFVSFIRQNIENRFIGLVNIVKAAGTAIAGFWEGDMAKVQKAGEDALTAIKQAQTGLDADQQTEFAASMEKLTDEAKRQANAFADLAAAKRAQRAVNRELEKSIENLSTAQELAAAQADDDTKSFAEREAAAERARIALEKRSAKEVELAKGNLALINRELDLRKANGEEVEDLLDSQLDAYRGVISAERELLLARQENASKTAKIEQDRLERDLDILIDGFDNQKTINERRIQDDAQTLEARRDILEETANLAEDSFRKQIEIVQSLTDAQVDANDLIMTSDAVVLNQKIRGLGLSEIIEGRLLEIIRDRRSANQDLADANKELYGAERDASLERLSDAQEAARVEFEARRTSALEQTDFAIAEKERELEEIQALNATYAGKLAAISTKAQENELRALKLGRKKIQEETALEEFDLEAELQASRLELLKRGEAEKQKASLEAEKARLQKILELNLKFGNDLTEAEKEILRNRIEALDNEIGNIPPDQYGSIWEVFGLDLPPGIGDAISSVVGTIKSQLQELISIRAEAAAAAVNQANAEVDASRAALNAEISNRNAGYAHQVGTAQKEFLAAKRTQDAALKEQEKAQLAKQRIDTIEQSVSLVTASANIWKSFSSLGPVGQILAPIAIGLMWGSFAASKIRASQITKEQYKEGGYEEIEGGSHASGNDTYLGFSKNGKPAYAEAGESHAIFNKKHKRKVGGAGRLRDIMSSIHKGTFDSTYAEIDKLHLDADGVSVSVVSEGAEATDMGEVAETLKDLRSDGRNSRFVNGQGQTVVIYKNVETTYV